METSAELGLLQVLLGVEKVRADEPMRLHTTMRVGGPADIFIEPATAADAVAAVSAVRHAGIPLTVLGNGSNVLVRDKGIRGAVLYLGKSFAGITADGTVLRAQAGALLPQVSREALRLGLSGLEFASGIPGSVGGAAAMNAGAYGREMKDAVLEVYALSPSGFPAVFKNEEMRYSYRHSRALEEGLIVLEAAFALKPGNPDEIKAAMDGYTQQRTEKQPLEMPSAGSFFKRPEGHFAGKLIADAGLRGFTVGGAKVSEKHAGFIVNTGNATASDILALAEEVQRRVFEASRVHLETEVRVIGEG